jgi:hypothetical protein
MNLGGHVGPYDALLENIVIANQKAEMMFKGTTRDKGHIPLCVKKFGGHVGCLNIFQRLTKQVLTEVYFGEFSGPIFILI